MSTTLILAVVVLTAGLVLPAPAASAAATLLVCPTGCPYASVSAAVAAASPGDAVVVRPGVYAGGLVVDKALVVCSTTAAGSACAPTAASTVLEGADGVPAVRVTGSNVVVRGFTLRNPAFVATDGAAPVEAALAVVDADRVGLLDNVFESPAAAPGPGESRWRTAAVVARAGSDQTVLLRNVMHGFVPGTGPEAACANAPCAVYGLLHEGGAGLTVAENDVRILGTGGPAAAVAFAGNNDAVVRDNFLRLPGTAPAGPTRIVGIDATAPATGALVERNDVATGLTEAPLGILGIAGEFHASTFRANVLRLTGDGLTLGPSALGGNLVEGNHFQSNERALVNRANGTTIRGNTFYLGVAAVTLDAAPGGGSVGIVLRENELRNHTTLLAVTAAVPAATYVDARENDWGQYMRTLIEARIRDESANHEIDVSCFIDNDGTTRVCPTASFSATRTNDTWPRSYRLEDTSVSGGRTIVARHWDLPDGRESNDSEVDVEVLPGSWPVTLTVTDSEGFQDTITAPLVATNAPPTMTPPGPLVATEGVPFSFFLSANDPDGDELRFTMEDAPPGAVLDPITGELTYTPPFNADGTSTDITFYASDGLEEGSSVATLSVVDTPLPPVLGPVPPRATLEQHPLVVVVTVEDPDGGVVALTASGVPSGASFVDHGDNTATFSWTPPTGSSGLHSVGILATAANALTDSATLEIAVTAGPGVSLTPITAGPVHASPGDVVTLRALLRNTGSGHDAFSLRTATSWANTTSTGPLLAPLEEIVVTSTVVVPAAGGSAVVRLWACSDAAPTLCVQAAWVVLTPVFLDVRTNASYALGEPVRASVHVTWLNGTGVAGATVSLRHDHELGLTRNTFTVTTDATGRGSMELRGTAAIPGAHQLRGQTIVAGYTALDQAFYGVRLV